MNECTKCMRACAFQLYDENILLDSCPFSGLFREGTSQVLVLFS